jgi:glucokinase
MPTFLAGDIGGTKTLLAVYQLEENRLVQQRCERFDSGAWSDFSAMLNHFLAAGGPSESRPAQGCLAVAGPVRQGRVRLTNLPWLLDEQVLAQQCDLAQLELVNDFAVLIHGLPHLSDNQQALLRAGNAAPDPQAPLAILGAGTGLGVAIGVPSAQGLTALASEASHGEFAPRTEQEWLLKSWLQHDLKLDRLSIERVVSGSGLGEVMRWLLATDLQAVGHPLAAASAAERPAATASAAAAGDPLAMRALELWLGAYGSAAGDLALQTLCHGGLWVGGGTAAKLLAGLQSSAFLEPMLNKGRLSEVVEQISVKAITDPEAGLFSAACRARSLMG